MALPRDTVGWSAVCDSCFHVLSSFEFILTRMKWLVALPMSFDCKTSVLFLFLTVPRFGLQCVTVVLPDHTHLLFQQVNKQRFRDYVYAREKVTMGKTPHYLNRDVIGFYCFTNKTLKGSVKINQSLKLLVFQYN